MNWLRDTLVDAAAAGLTDIDTTEAVTCYRTPRGGSEHSTNRRLPRSDSLLPGYDAFHVVDQLMTQPLQVVLAGRIGNTGSYDMGVRLWKMRVSRGIVFWTIRRQDLAERRFERVEVQMHANPRTRRTPAGFGGWPGARRGHPVSARGPGTSSGPPRRVRPLQ
ncbi:hypothetical protein ACWEWP_11950 [Streptomyces olivaceus]